MKYRLKTLLGLVKSQALPDETCSVILTIPNR